jgi:hypothetical protein
MENLDEWESELESDDQIMNIQSSSPMIQITGTVTAEGEPLIGCTVIVAGTTRGTITDMQGRYSVNVPSTASKLTFSHIGYDSKDIKIKAHREINVNMSSFWDGFWGSVLSIGGEDVKGAVSGAMGGAAAGSLAGGVGALPGAGVGAISGSVAQSAYAGLSYLF